MLKRAAAFFIVTLIAIASFAVFENADARSRHRSHQGTPGQFDFYVFSLSWSPSFCESGGGRGNSDEQCNRGRPFAFVVHGLWPQYERGFPENCEQPAPWVDQKLI